jgi:hypothetical protein
MSARTRAAVGLKVVRFCARMWQRAQLTGFSFQRAFRRNYGSSTAIRVALFGRKLRGDLHRPVGKRAVRSAEWSDAIFRNLLNLKALRSRLGEFATTGVSAA